MLQRALASDLGRPMLESNFCEIGGVIGEALEAYNNVHIWAKTESILWTINYGALNSRLMKEPKGVVLNIV